MPYADNGGVKIFFDTYGQGTPIVFLHPWTTNGYIWYFQIFPFARTNQVIAIDHRGHGRSDKPAEWLFNREPCERCCGGARHA